jgi:hypothetical protein
MTDDTNDDNEWLDKEIRDNEDDNDHVLVIVCSVGVCLLSKLNKGSTFQWILVKIGYY